MHPGGPVRTFEIDSQAPFEPVLFADLGIQAIS